jgi:hypothetical protein
MKGKLVVIDWRIQRRVKSWLLWVALPFSIVGGVGALAYAGSIPNQFTRGQPLTALALTENFNNVEGRLNQLESQALPSGTVLFFNLGACPPGWSVLQAAQGRYVVGLGTGTLAATVGTALADQENRPVGQHGHAINDPGHSHGVSDPGHNHGGVTGPEGHDVDDIAFGYSGGASCPKSVPFVTNSGCYDYWNEHTHPIAASTTGVTVNGSATGITVANAGGLPGPMHHTYSSWHARRIDEHALSRFECA